MTFLLRILTLLSILALIMGCGGTKVLTTGEVEQLAPAEKETYMQKMVKDHPESSVNFTSLASFYLQKNENNKALLVLKQGKNAHPSNAGINFMYGQLAIQQGQNQEGFRAFKAVLTSPDAYSYKDKISSYVQEKYSVVPVVNDPSADAYPVYSPDGESIYFQTNRNGNWDIYQFNIISNELKQITTSEADEELPWVSPDGKFLYYSSSKDDKRPVSYVSKSRNICMKNLEDGTETNLTNTLANDWLPRTDWKNENIVFVSERKDLRDVGITDKKSFIYTMESTGDFQIPLVEEEGIYGNPVYSHDNQYIYYDVKRNANYEISRYSIEKETNVTIVSNPGSDNVGAFPAPNDSTIVYFSNRDGNFELYQLNIPSNEEERLTTNPGNDLNPIYSGDGTKIIFFSDRYGNYDIFYLDFTKAGTSMSMQDVIAALDRLIN